MALPPKGDPRRPLHLAIRSTRLLGIIFISLGSLVFVPMFMFGFRGMRGGMTFILPILALSALIYIGPGAAYLVIAYFLKRRRSWAIVTGLILASIQLILALIAAVSIAILLFKEDVGGVGLLGAAVVSLVILALAQLIYHLAKSFEAIKHVPIEEQRGFEPLMLQPVERPPT